MANNTIIGKQYINGGLLEYGEKDPTTGQRYELFTPNIQPPTTPPTPTGGQPAKPVSVISTDMARSDVANKNADLLKIAQDMQTRLATLKEAVDKKAKEEADAKIATANAPKDTTASDLQALGIMTEKSFEQQQAEKQAEVIANYDKEMEDVNAKMEQWQVVNNQQTQNIIANIQAQYQERKKSVEDIYLRQSKSMEQLGIRTGATRYSAEGMGGILTEIEKKKQNELSALDQEAQGLILSAQRASSENDFKLLAQQMSEISENRDKAIQSLRELQAEALKVNQAKEQELQTVKRQGVILQAIQGGMTNAGDIALQYGIDINEVGSVLDVYLKDTGINEGLGDIIPGSGGIDKEGNRVVSFYNPDTQEINTISLYKEKPATEALPSSFKEWQLAGGEAGTGKSYAEFIAESTIKPATVSQQTVAGYASRLEQAEPTLKSLEKNITKMNMLNFETQIKLPAALQSAEIQQYMQASRNFINAVLRRESGAVISPSEFSEARKQYLPQPGDKPETLKLKDNNRKAVLANYINGSGSAYTPLSELIGSGDLKSQVNQKGYDYDKMKADGLSDDEIKQAINQ